MEEAQQEFYEAWTGNRFVQNSIGGIGAPMWHCRFIYQHMAAQDSVEVVTPEGTAVGTARISGSISDTAAEIRRVIEAHRVGNASPAPLEPVPERDRGSVVGDAHPVPAEADERIIEIPLGAIGHFPGGNVRERFSD
ncbi:MAG: hypothetical protein Q8R28_16340, partial [Dehalococcoidia bacterium]|nr:hypothetical protein [Dehalococcoidia bacterium]